MTGCGHRISTCYLIVDTYFSSNSGGDGGGDGKGGCIDVGGVCTFLCKVPLKAKKVNLFPAVSYSYCNMLGLGPRK